MWWIGDKRWLKVVVSSVVLVGILALNAINGVQAAPDIYGETGDHALVILNTADVTALRQAADILEEAGARITHIMPQALIGPIPKDLPEEVLTEAGVIAVYRAPVDVDQVTALAPLARTAALAWNQTFATPPKPSVTITAQSLGAELTNDAMLPPDLPEMLSQSTASDPTPGFYQTSEFMIGRVAVGIVLVESDGTVDPSTEDWTDEEKALVYSEIVAATEWWAAREPRAHLQFIYDDHFTNPLPVSYEPITRPYQDQRLWIAEAMNQLGFTEGTSYFTQVRYYNNALREKYGTDWAFTIFVVDSSNDPDNKFADGHFAYAYLGGPFMVMTYGNNGYGPYNMDAVAAHEMGHIFLALDQYAAARQPCDARSGYLDAENQNSQYGSCSSDEPSIMRGQVFPYSQGAIDYYARGQVGWWDSDGDGILDPVDTTLDFAWQPVTPTINSDDTLVYTGLVRDIPFPSPRRADVTINTITTVQYRLDGGEWQEATPADGSFDFHTEAFTITLQSLPAGVHTLDLRAVNSAGVEQILPGADTITVYGLDTVLEGYQPTDPKPGDEALFEGMAVALDPTGTTAVGAVQYRLDGGEWRTAEAEDGSFDSPIENFHFITDPLSPGVHTVEVRTLDINGNPEDAYATTAITVTEKPAVYYIYLPLVARSTP